MGEDGRVSKEIVGLALLEMCCRRVSDERGRTSSTKTLFSVNALLKKKNSTETLLQISELVLILNSFSFSEHDFYK